MSTGYVTETRQKRRLAVPSPAVPLLGAALLLFFASAPWSLAAADAQEGGPVVAPRSQPPYVTGSAEGEIPAAIGPSVGWRVVRDVAEPPGQAADEVRALGFGVPIDDPILTTNVDTGNEMRFEPGEVFYVIDESTTRRESLTDETVPYYRIALVPDEETSDPGGDTLIFAGDAFDLPADVSDLVIRATAYEIDDGERRPVGGARTVLLLVVEGALEYSAIDDQAGTLQAGEAVTIVVPPNGGPDSDRIDLTGRDAGGTRYVFAIVQQPPDQ